MAKSGIIFFMNTQKQIFTIIGLLILLGFAWYALNRVNEQGQEPAPSPVGDKKETPAVVQAPETKEEELKKEDIALGKGVSAKDGDTVVVGYVGTLTDGRKFDSSYDRNEPFTFTLGAHEVIKGWELGIQGMRVGGKRKLIIPPSFGYGQAGAPGSIIGPNQTLIFEITMLKLNP